jgi:hypothetical protein
MAHIRKYRKRGGLALGATLVVAVVAGSLAGTGSAASPQIQFRLVRSAGAVTAGCLAHAGGKVTVTSHGTFEIMRVKVHGLPARKDFDLFVIQVPNAPFGLSWYQGDIETDATGRGSGVFIGRFSIETFIVAPGTAPAPVVFHNTFPDASSNPATGPVHEYHVGLWFNSPKTAAKAGCGSTVTPFNGTHNAGVQILSTRQFSDLHGPLRQLS